MSQGGSACPGGFVQGVLAMGPTLMTGEHVLNECLSRKKLTRSCVD